MCCSVLPPYHTKPQNTSKYRSIIAKLLVGQPLYKTEIWQQKNTGDIRNIQWLFKHINIYLDHHVEAPVLPEAPTGLLLAPQGRAHGCRGWVSWCIAGGNTRSTCLPNPIWSPSLFPLWTFLYPQSSERGITRVREKLGLTPEGKVVWLESRQRVLWPVTGSCWPGVPS